MKIKSKVHQKDKGGLSNMEMEKVIAILNELKNMNSTYGISSEAVTELCKEIEMAKVCTPIIGKFSSGKSALVNTLLGYSIRILREDITPETAIPTEIVYTDSEETVTFVGNDGVDKDVSINEYRAYEADANKIKCARICLRNSFLEEIPDVMLVDMPGFESGFEVHNKAIDNYLPDSLAYIVVFPADDMIVRSSVGNILKELCLHDMPLCVVITKYDKRNDEFDVAFEKMNETLKRYIGDRDIRFCRTSSFTGDAEEVKVFLKEIQEESQKILASKYKLLTMPIVENLENYLITTMNGSKLSESELYEKEEKLHKQLSGLNSKFLSEQEEFELHISECIEEIKNDVQIAMEAEEHTLVAMAMNNQEVNNHLNSIVRNAVTVSLKKRFFPIVERYLKKVSKVINNELVGDVHTYIAFDSEKLNKVMTNRIVSVVASLLLGGPILGFIVSIFMKIRSDKKREEAKQEIRQKLRREVYPKVISDVGSGIEMTISKQIVQINTNIEEELKNQRNTLEKAMADLRQQINYEEGKKKNLLINIKNNLERVEEIKDELR